MDGESAATRAQGAADVGVTIARTGATGVFTLDRPKARNAVNAAMIAAMAAEIPRLARDPNVYGLLLRSSSDGMFSAGGDLREIAGIGGQPIVSLAHEYGLVWLFECFSKPTVALIDGAVMGSGVGLTLYATHRVAGPRYAFSMPETAIGLFPDVGTASVFSRMPGEVGTYLGLTGRAIGPADAYRLGLVTHVVPGAEFAAVEAAFADVEPIDRVLDARHVDPGPGDLVPHLETIAEAFSAPSVVEILARLEATTTDAAWAKAVAADLRRKSPLALAVTLRHIRRAGDLDLRLTLMVDDRVMRRMLREPDFREGVRALLIDKDKNPRWSPARLEEVTEATLERLFAPAPGAQMLLPTRQEMQAARV